MSATKSLEEGRGDNVEDLQNAQTQATYINAGSGLSPEHQQYLIQRHGTVDLDPVPGPGGADPYNWPHWKVCETIVFYNPLINRILESGQSHPRGDPRNDDHLHGSIYHPSISDYCRGSRGVSPTSHLPNLSPNLHSRCSSSYMEAFREHVRKTASVPPLPAH
jgi:hypothetical protein